MLNVNLNSEEPIISSCNSISNKHVNQSPSHHIQNFPDGLQDQCSKISSQNGKESFPNECRERTQDESDACVAIVPPDDCSPKADVSIDYELTTAAVTAEESRQLHLENAALRRLLLALQGELCGARLAAKYLDKELAGRSGQ